MRKAWTLGLVPTLLIGLTVDRVAIVRRRTGLRGPARAARPGPGAGRLAGRPDLKAEVRGIWPSGQASDLAGRELTGWAVHERVAIR